MKNQRTLSKNKKSKISRVLLDFEEWFFEDCPELERRFCFFYEYLRQSQVIRGLVAKHRTQGGLEGEMALLKDLKPLIELDEHVLFDKRSSTANEQEPDSDDDDAFDQNLVSSNTSNVFDIISTITSLKEFPTKPWLQIKPGRRKQRLAKHRISRQPPRFHYGVLAEELEALARHRRAYATQETILVVRVPIGTTADELVGYFQEDVKKQVSKGLQRGDPNGFLKLQGKRGTYVDSLRRLGALRVLEKMSAEDALDFTRKQLQKHGEKYKTLIYGDANEFRKAKRKAEVLLNKFVKEESEEARADREAREAMAEYLKSKPGR